MPRTREPMTKERIRAFLAAYRAGWGNFSAACRAVAPHSDAALPCRSSWLQLRDRDPHFRQQLEEIDAEIKDEVFEEVRSRALHGTLEAVYQKGARVFEPVLDENDQVVRDGDGNPKMRPASITRYDNRLLLALARRIDPAWVERNIHEHTGEVEHKLVTSAELLRMSPDELATVEKALEILGQKEATAGALEYQPAIEAEFEEVEPDAIEGFERMSNGT